MLFKKEESHSFLANNDDGDGDDDIDHSSIIGAYQLLWRIIKLPSVLSLIVVLLTAKVTFIKQNVFKVKSHSLKI